MKLLKRIFYSACAAVPTSLLQNAAGVKILLPYQHLVDDNEVLHIKHLYAFKNVTRFKNDIDFLLKHFNPVSPEQVADAINSGKKLPDNPFLITFDDGFRQVHDVIAPVLFQKGVPAIFFINPAFIDNTALFYRCKISLIIEELLKIGEKKAVSLASEITQKTFSSFQDIKTYLKNIKQDRQQVLDVFAVKLNYSFAEYLKRYQPFLTTTQILALNNQGFTIGGHSWDHPYYSLLSVEDQLKETLDATAFIKRLIPARHSYFSFPHSDASVPQSFFDRLHTGPDKIDVLFGIQNQKTEIQNNMLHRFNAERPELDIQKQVNGILLYSILHKAMGKHKINRL